MVISQEELSRIIGILRTVTKVVKLIPFAYALLYIISILSYSMCSENVSIWVDMIFYVSPLSIIFLLILARTLKLCKWHRLECVLPLMGFCAVLINDFIIEFGKYGQLANYIIVITTFILSLINAYFVFIKPKN
jgi:hypothetical protein